EAEVGGLLALVGQDEPPVGDLLEEAVLDEPVEVGLVVAGLVAGIVVAEPLLLEHPADHPPAALAQADLRHAPPRNGSRPLEVSGRGESAAPAAPPRRSELRSRR